MRIQFCRLVVIVTISFVIPLYILPYCSGIISDWLNPKSCSADAFLSARDLWMRRSFAHYKLVVEQEGHFLLQCHQEFDVIDEKIVTVTKNTCINYITNEVRLSIEFYINTNAKIFVTKHV